MVDIEIAALKILTLNDARPLLRFQRHKPMPESRDILVLHPNHSDGIKHRNHKEYSVFAAVHATLAGVNYICRLAYLSDEQILAATESGYTEDQVHEWIRVGNDMFHGLSGGLMAEAGTQLEVAVKGGLSRIIQR